MIPYNSKPFQFVLKDLRFDTFANETQVVPDVEVPTDPNLFTFILCEAVCMPDELDDEQLSVERSQYIRFGDIVSIKRIGLDKMIRYAVFENDFLEWQTEQPIGNNLGMFRIVSKDPNQTGSFITYHEIFALALEVEGVVDKYFSVDNNAVLTTSRHRKHSALFAIVPKAD